MLVEHIKESGKPCLLALNKTDAVEPQWVLPVIEAWSQVHDFVAIVPVGVIKEEEAGRLLQAIVPLLPEGPPLYPTDQPVATVSGMFSASSPAVKDRIERYAVGRGTSSNPQHNQRLFTIDMNLYSEFVGHEVASQLMWAEQQRLSRQNARATTQQPDVQQPDSP